MYFIQKDTKEHIYRNSVPSKILGLLLYHNDLTRRRENAYNLGQTFAKLTLWARRTLLTLAVNISTSVTFDLEGEILLQLKSCHLHFPPREIKFGLWNKTNKQSPSQTGFPLLFHIRLTADLGTSRCRVHAHHWFFSSPTRQSGIINLLSSKAPNKPIQWGQTGSNHILTPEKSICTFLKFTGGRNQSILPLKIQDCIQFNSRYPENQFGLTKRGFIFIPVRVRGGYKHCRGFMFSWESWALFKITSLFSS